MVNSSLAFGVPANVFLDEHSLRAAAERGIPEVRVAETLADILYALVEFRSDLAEPQYWKALAHPISVESVEDGLIEKPIQTESSRVAMELHNALALLSKYTLLWDEVVCILLGSELRFQVEPGMSCADVQKRLRQDRAKYPAVVALLTQIAATAWQLRLMQIGQQPAATFAKYLPAVPWDLIPDVSMEQLFRHFAVHADAASFAARRAVNNLTREVQKVASSMLGHAVPASERLFPKKRFLSAFASLF